MRSPVSTRRFFGLGWFGDAGGNFVSDPIPFPAPALSDDEKLARLKARAEALASKPEFEWKHFLDKHAADIGIAPDALKGSYHREHRPQG
jgi:hypothetical protein